MDEAPGHLIVELSGLPIAALTWGPADGPLALLSHGFPDTAWSWRHVGPMLAAHGWRVFAPFSRGYAPTGFAPDGHYEVGALARDVVELHGALGGDERALLVGHDWGALAAYAVCGVAPDLFAQVVTLSVPPTPSIERGLRGLSGARLGLRQARNSWYIAANQVPGLSERVFDRLTRRLWSDWSPGYDATEDLAHLAAALPTLARRRAAVDYYRATIQPWRRSADYRAEQRAALRAPTRPILYLHGADDGCMSAAFAAGVLDDLAVGSRVCVVENAGHFVQLEQPNVVADEVLRFVGPLPGSSGLRGART